MHQHLLLGLLDQQDLKVLPGLQALRDPLDLVGLESLKDHWPLYLQLHQVLQVLQAVLVLQLLQ